jgi:iron complex transport system permease protein
MQKTGFSILLLLMVPICYASLHTGSYSVTNKDIVNIFFSYNPAEPLQVALHDLRLPRLLVALAAGASLSFAGYLMQLLVNNPLADPYTCGTASGASLGANLALAGIIPVFVNNWFMPPLFSFAGALLATLLVLYLASESSGTETGKLLLAGIAISSFLNAIVGLVTFLSDSEGKLRSLVFWMMGSFEKANWTQVYVLGFTVLALVIPFGLLHRHLNLMLLGSHKSRLMGLNIGLWQKVLLLGACLATAVCVSVCGIIGFVGLLVPHLIRSVFGATGRYNIWLSAYTGGLFMALADTLSRIIYPPAGLPIGIITSFAGIPFFVYLLAQKRYRFN